MVHHGEALRRETKDETLVKQLAEDYRKTNLDPKTMAILEHAERITRDAASITQAKILGLREKGLSDEEILHAAAIASYFNYINRVSDALGVELEPEWEEGRTVSG